ncbi:MULTISPECIES: 3-isopropylmalate dehydrogenase [unclassified Fusibacter]|uniref:3-isopropylmalate dehydrogenase n=1 Tax=unclassified Fusibacter TaxID=2624464 RepID=UPI001012A595|nr:MULTISPECIES: 3-isopropylmalate dehydrogenase [unclassified Fusibacter]MCK8059179.1 3-isopropylmalate dehydrogenase [Fusibacter sp. A2]NPE22588.1 3-isopropylmalate dehydrogenase [Fusibacter sp. A1]RXV60689.1 3-isopropylmalate dehydrogenase [Fusibacter sp. A1]
MKKTFSVIKGDGIGPEIVDSAIEVLNAVAGIFGHEFEYSYLLAGGAAINKYGHPLPEETIETCKKTDAVLLGAVGGPQWEHLPGDLRPEKGLLMLRKALGLYGNLRPAKVFDALKDASPLKPEIIGDNFDMLVVRELTGGIYFGERGRDGDSAYDTERYSKYEVQRIARIAFETARKRKGKVTNVDKMNVLESSRLWRETVLEVAADYPEITLDHQLVDNAAMQLVRNPSQFDVLLTSNMFGDILSDEASMITGSIGMLPSASIGIGTLGLYEPIHGSAPDIAGTGTANPLATILSAAMMLRHSCDMHKEASSIERAIEDTLNCGYRTSDIAANKEFIGLHEMTQQIISRLKIG